MERDHGKYVSVGGEQFRWVDRWAKIPPSESARTGWAHHGIIATPDGKVISFHQSDGTALVFDGDGNLIRSWPTGLVEGHGMTLVREEKDYIWFSDNGTKRKPDLNYEYPAGEALPSGKVVKVDLEGRVVMELPKPGFKGYSETRYAPTSVAVDEPRFGGKGDIWVTDGYGLSLLHRFDKYGRHISTLDGTEGAGRFDTPHAVFLDRRRQVPELYVADRSNKRVQVYDLEGRFKRSFGEGFLNSPSGFAAHDGNLYVAELRARVAVLDIEDRLISYVGENEQACDRPGWPNALDRKGRVIQTEDLVPGRFNSPHGITTDAEGNVYVAEWLIGGRVIKLAKT